LTATNALKIVERTGTREDEMQSRSWPGIEDHGHGNFVKVDCAACHHVALLTPVFLLRLELSPHAKVLDLKQRVRCRGCGARGRAVVSIKWRRQVG
jgi:ribosomal protein S27E